MKQLVLIILLTGCVFATSAQTDFGIKAGVSLTFFNEDQGDFGLDAQTDVDYFGGVFLDVEITEAFHIQPELLYKGLGDFEFLIAPIYFKYNVGINFNILAGPSLNYFFNFFANNFKVRADVSAAYNLSSALDINMKYTFGLEEVSPNVLFLGLGYRL